MPSESKLFKVKYGLPFQGINTVLPENEIGKEFTPSCLNFMSRNGELFTRPRMVRFIDGPQDNRPIRAICTFLDSNYVSHTVCVTATGLWQLSRYWNNPPISIDPVTTGQIGGPIPITFSEIVPPPLIPAWNLVGQFGTIPGPDVPYANAVFINKFFFTNGGNTLNYWDGITNNIQTATTVAGALFLIELDAHLIMGYTVEGGVPFPQRIRWSVSGNVIDTSSAVQDAWNPATNVGAGFNDMLDVPDQILGLAPIGRVGFIYRTNGITEITPVGKGTQPFNFDHLWASNNGIGNIYPYTLAIYGPNSVFIAKDEIYYMTIGALNTVGGGARDAIYNDLNTAIAQPVASIFPRMTETYIHLCYELAVPQVGGCKYWRLDLNTKSWFPWFTSNKYLTSSANYIATF